MPEECIIVVSKTFQLWKEARVGQTLSGVFSISRPWLNLRIHTGMYGNHLIHSLPEFSRGYKISRTKTPVCPCALWSSFSSQAHQGRAVHSPRHTEGHQSPEGCHFSLTRALGSSCHCSVAQSERTAWAVSIIGSEIWLGIPAQPPPWL